MSLRRTLNERRGFVAAAVVLLICAACFATYYQLKPAPRGTIPTGVWFIPENGTSFADCVVMPMETLPPSQRDGRTLVKAHVLSVNGQNRVLYLKKLSDKAAREMAARKGNLPVQTAVDMNVGGLLVKRPGDAKWVAMVSKEGSAIVREAASTDGNDIPAMLK